MNATALEWIQLVVTAVGVAVAIARVMACSLALRTDAPHAGFWRERRATGLMLLCLQLMWLTTSVFTMGVGGSPPLMALRGICGSLLLTAVMVFERWNWRRMTRHGVTP